MKPAQDKPHRPGKTVESEKKEPQFSQSDAEGKSLSTDRRQHGKTVAEPKTVKLKES